jgi:hypothetical protein
MFSNKVISFSLNWQAFLKMQQNNFLISLYETHSWPSLVDLYAYTLCVQKMMKVGHLFA